MTEAFEPGLASVALVRHLVEHLKLRDLHVRPLLRGLRITEDALARPEGLIPLADGFVLLRRGAEAVGDPWLGLTLGATAQVSSHGVVGFLLANHPTFGAGLRDLARALGLLLPDVVMSTEPEPGGGLAFVAVGFRDLVGGEVFVHETFASLVTVGRSLTRSLLTPVRIQLRDEAPAANVLARWRAVFGVVPEFGAERDALVFGPEVEDLHVPDAEPLLLAHLYDAIEAQVTRRRRASHAGPSVLRLGARLVDLARGEVHDGQDVVPLTSKEQALLAYLAERPNALVTKDELERSVWGLGRHVVSHAPAVAMRRLRQKIEKDPARPVHLVTVFGEGWKLVVAPSPELSGDPPQG
ncbi:MAG: AraC family transcriptional regulator ligand-binding domain-containing protein [Alphaproteobacteria bacterium]|nr:AraC family transcriptional regulator ligand-binding domain-containing protein [Alphaproteobacteria bacterium]